MKVPRNKGAGGRAVAGLVVGGLIAGGCGTTPPRDVTVRWLLADGRSCIDAAVLSVAIQAVDPRAPGGGSIVTGACPADARLAGQLLIPQLVPGVPLQGQGLSSSNSVLYKGAVTVPDPVPAALDLTLYFTGGK